MAYSMRRPAEAGVVCRVDSLVEIGPNGGPGDKGDGASARLDKVCSLRGGARRTGRDPSRALTQHE